MRPAVPILTGLTLTGLTLTGLPRPEHLPGRRYLLPFGLHPDLPGLPLHPSDDLVARRLVGPTIYDPGQFDFGAVPDSRGIFAPTIRHHDGTPYIACTLMDAGEVTGNFSVTATDIAGPWSSPVMLPDARTRPGARSAGGRGIRHLDAHYGPAGLG